MNSRLLLIASAATLPLLLSACEIGPKKSSQWGPNGAALNQVVNPRLAKQEVPIPATPYAVPDDSGPRAGVTYQNVQVLGGVSTERFNHLMASMNNWVAPQTGKDPNEIGCNYCHNPANMASDEKYPKVVARRMIQMTQNINANWTSHVQGTGVTCWTCHRGNTIPLNRWSNDAPGDVTTIMGNKRGQNTPDARVAYASLPYGGFEGYLAGPQGFNARVAGGAYPSPDHVVSTKSAERTYGVMMHMSSSLGVNCTYCHNTQAFAQWKLSSNQRSTAWYGTRMVRQANYEYVTPLGSTLPADQKGPHGDPWKINCATCHQGVNKPMGGVSMRADNPTLWPAGVAAAPLLRAPVADPNATAASCDADFAKALAGKTIEFDTGKATISPASSALLDTLTSVAGRCSNFRMSVEGHTDAVGNPASNQTLSQARAAAVEKYMAAKGVSEAQMVATGYGQTRPVDTSGTPAGNQKNRRIEINVAGK
jgi:photosynthetic reaction center cytochrome c subunit